MFNKFNPDGGDLGRGITVRPHELPMVFGIVASFFDGLPKDNYVFALETIITDWSFANKGLSEISAFINQLVHSYPPLKLYKVDGRVIFEIRHQGAPTGKAVFYLLQNK